MKPTPIVENSIKILIPFFDVDPLSIVWHGHYIKYFEMARCALLEKIDYNYIQMKKSGFAWPVIDIRVKYVAPAKFNQTICVNAALVEYENRLKVDYLITDEKSQQKLTKGHSIQVACNVQTNEMCFASPKVFTDKLKRFL
jgi:acyl-CoA thioester hydrolase